MIEVSDSEFKKIVSEGIDRIPEPYQSHLQNIAFVVEDIPSEQQRQRSNLKPGETLFGLYEGLPLPQRGGVTKLLPDKITIFRLPLLAASWNLADLKNKVAKTIWHEVAHYFGLDHDRIHSIENKHQINDQEINH
jgi:predicted Zn-dependent protease with MMP-like domain